MIKQKTLAGAIVGGVIGNNIKNVENGAAVGALIGGIIGNQNSDAMKYKDGFVKQNRYNEQIVNEYSHSEVTFTYEIKRIPLSFRNREYYSLLVKIRLFLPEVGFGSIKENPMNSFRIECSQATDQYVIQALNGKEINTLLNKFHI